MVRKIDMIKTVLLLALFNSTLVTTAEAVINPIDTIDKRGTMSSSETADYLADMQICHLKNGALLVRMHSRNKVAEAVSQSGNKLMGEEMLRKQQERNRDIYEAFEKHWDFCPVYFFEAESSKAVKTINRENIIFLGEKLKRDTEIRFPEGNFLTAEFGTLSESSEETFELRYMTSDGNWIVELHDDPQKGSGSFSAFHIMSNSFRRLSKPFPYFVRTYDDLIFRRQPSATVRKMNRRLHDFSKRCE